MTATTGALVPENAEESERAKIEEYLETYRPTGLPEELWLPLRDESADLVRTAGAIRFDRVRKDLQAVGALATYANAQQRELSLASMLTEPMLLEFDQAVLSGRSSGTRENLRGRLRRLKDTLNGVATVIPRRRPEERAQSIPAFELMAQVNAVNEAAAGDSSPAAAAWRTCWAALTSGGSLDWPDDLPASLWTQARAYAVECGTPLTKRQVRVGCVHDALTSDVPVAVLTALLGLTRRDLDLALVHPAAGGALSTEELRLLRGEVRARRRLPG